LRAFFFAADSFVQAGIAERYNFARRLASLSDMDASPDHDCSHLAVPASTTSRDCSAPVSSAHHAQYEGFFGWCPSFSGIAHERQWRGVSAGADEADDAAADAFPDVVGEVFRFRGDDELIDVGREGTARGDHSGVTPVCDRMPIFSDKTPLYA